MLEYRIAIESNVDEITDIHINTFNGFFLTSLGKGFLKTYYRSCIKSNSAITICAYDVDEKIVGFSVGCLRSKGFHKKLILDNPVAFSKQGIMLLLKKPGAIIRLLNNLKKESSTFNDDGKYAELLSIGVLTEKKGLGIGKGLLLDFEKRVGSKGVDKVTLTTDVNNNDGVLGFYKSMGYSNFYEFIAYPDRQMFKLIKNL